MSSPPLSNVQKFVDLLGSSAMYNDKGIHWSGHSPAKAEEMQAAFHREQMTLAQEIGPDRLGPDLLSAIQSGAASRDGSGHWANLAEKVLGLRRSGA